MPLRARRTFERVLADQYRAEHSASVVVVGNLSRVWSAVMDPRTSVDMDPTVIDADRWGPARGLGEIQAFLHRSGTGRRVLFAHEVIEYEHERRVLTEGLTYLGHWTRAEVVIAPAGPGSVRISHRWWQGFPQGTAVRHVKAAMRAFHERVESTVSDYSRVFEVVAEG